MFEGEFEDAGGDDEIGPVESLGINALLRNTELAMAQQSRMEWERYAAAAMLHRHLVEPTAGTEAEMRALDPFAQCAARLSAAQGLTQRTAELQINRGRGVARSSACGQRAVEGRADRRASHPGHHRRGPS